ncbi:MAG TPA: crosslink repair DNA glycosylase YcaQ family protein [Anaerolineaceae bacterium]
MKNSIKPALKISKTEARRFILFHQGLLPPRKGQGKAGIMEFIRRVGCIQFDPVNVVERNPELVLQARISAYSPELLDDLLYRDRALVDGFDKMAAIYPVEDWPAFCFRRQQVQQAHQVRADLEDEFMSKMIETVRNRGPLSSLDFEKTVRITGYWGASMHVERFALERLLDLGKLIIHHRTGSRRYYDLAERVLPPQVYSAPDPFENFEGYQEWHVLRRIGGMGIANSGAGEYWGGIAGTKSQGRWDALHRLISQGKLLPVEIDEIPERTFFIRASDWQQFVVENVQSPAIESSKCIFLGPLDNLLWDRDLIRLLFNFNYIWEVYKPVSIRSYGPYTLPILLGDTFVGRVDLKFDRKKRTLILNNLWWEKDIRVDEKMQSALAAGFKEFLRFLRADRIQLSETIKENGSVCFLKAEDLKV